MGRTLETLQGVGKIFSADTEVGEMEYTLTVYQKTIDTGRGGEVDGLKTVEGVLTEVSGLTLFDMVGKPPFTLHLEDGRRWDFVLFRTELGGNVGTAKNAGKGLYIP